MYNKAYNIAYDNTEHRVLRMSADDNIETIETSNLIGNLNDIEQKFAPKELYIIGNKALASKSRSISIIGTRQPTSKGMENARIIAEFLVKNNVIIVSGLAKGIDTIAHESAIRNKGNTIAVIGTPLDTCYPKENSKLQDTIKNNHLLISQFRIGSPILPSNFPARNRTMALISRVSVIVEASDKSGTMHQGWEALRLGRRLFILEDLANNKNLSWPSKLIKYGAEVLSIKDLSVLLDSLPEELSETQEDVWGNQLVTF
ncbi:MAG: DNA-processing protein DprA [Candidatus Woesearchaeota archaeon]